MLPPENESSRFLREHDPNSSLSAFVNTNYGSKSGLLPLESLTPQIFMDHIFDKNFPIKSLDALAADDQFVGPPVDMFVAPNTDVLPGYDFIARQQGRIADEMRAYEVTKQAFGHDAASEGLEDAMGDLFTYFQELSPSHLPSVHVRVSIKPHISILNNLTGSSEIGPHQIHLFNERYGKFGLSYGTTVALDYMSFKHIDLLENDYFFPWMQALRMKALEASRDFALAIGRNSLVYLEDDVVIPELEGEIHVGLFPPGGQLVHTTTNRDHVTGMFVGYVAEPIG